jgi:hypothetical protein
MLQAFVTKRRIAGHAALETAVSVTGANPGRNHLPIKRFPEIQASCATETAVREPPRDRRRMSA